MKLQNSSPMVGKDRIYTCEVSDQPAYLRDTRRTRLAPLIAWILTHINSRLSFLPNSGWNIINCCKSLWWTGVESSHPPWIFSPLLSPFKLPVQIGADAPAQENTSNPRFRHWLLPAAASNQVPSSIDYHSFHWFGNQLACSLSSLAPNSTEIFLLGANGWI